MKSRHETCDQSFRDEKDKTRGSRVPWCDLAGILSAAIGVAAVVLGLELWSDLRFGGGECRSYYLRAADPWAYPLLLSGAALWAGALAVLVIREWASSLSRRWHHLALASFAVLVAASTFWGYSAVYKPWHWPGLIVTLRTGEPVFARLAAADCLYWHHRDGNNQDEVIAALRRSASSNSSAPVRRHSRRLADLVEKGIWDPN